MPRIPGFEIRPGLMMPMIVVTLQHNGQGVSNLGLVDSGADVTIIPASWIEACGTQYATLPDPKQGNGAGGPFEFKLVQGQLSYNGREFCDHFQVAAPQHKLPWPLLGRNDFFQRYVVRFAWHRKPPDFNLDPVK